MIQEFSATPPDPDQKCIHRLGCGVKICNIVKQAAEDLTGEEVLAIGWNNGPGSGLIELEGGETIHMDDWLANGYLQYERGRFELVEGDFGPFGAEARGITYVDANPEQTQEANAI